MQTEILEEIKTEYKEPSVQIFILNLNNPSFKTKGKSYEIKILGKPMCKWVESACKPYKTNFINCSINESVMQCVLPHLTDSDITCVLYADTPLLKHSTIVNAIDYLNFKNIDAIKLPRGFVFKTKVLKSGLNVNFQESCIGGEEEFYAVLNLQAVAEASSVLQTRINNFHMQNGVLLQNPKTITIDADVSIGNNVTILSGTVVKGNSVIGDDVTIKENCVIENSVIEKGSVIFDFNKILNSQICENCLILSFNNISANTVVNNNATIENFCVLKGANIAENEEICAYSNIDE